MTQELTNTTQQGNALQIIDQRLTQMIRQNPRRIRTGWMRPRLRRQTGSLLRQRTRLTLTP